MACKRPLQIQLRDRSVLRTNEPAVGRWMMKGSVYLDSIRKYRSHIGKRTLSHHQDVGTNHLMNGLKNVLINVKNCLIPKRCEIFLGALRIEVYLMRDRPQGIFDLLQLTSCNVVAGKPPRVSRWVDVPPANMHRHSHNSRRRRKHLGRTMVLLDESGPERLVRVGVSIGIPMAIRRNQQSRRKRSRPTESSGSGKR